MGAYVPMMERPLPSGEKHFLLLVVEADGEFYVTYKKDGGEKIKISPKKKQGILDLVREVLILMVVKEPSADDTHSSLDPAPYLRVGSLLCLDFTLDIFTCLSHNVALLGLIFFKDWVPRIFDSSGNKD